MLYFTLSITTFFITRVIIIIMNIIRTTDVIIIIIVLTTIARLIKQSDQQSLRPARCACVISRAPLITGLLRFVRHLAFSDVVGKSTPDQPISISKYKYKYKSICALGTIRKERRIVSFPPRLRDF